MDDFELQTLINEARESLGLAKGVIKKAKSVTELSQACEALAQEAQRHRRAVVEIDARRRAVDDPSRARGPRRHVEAPTSRRCPFASKACR
jgi:hypothetical protein